jgi:Integrase core domain
LTSHLRTGVSVGLSPRGEVGSVNNEQHEQNNRYDNNQDDHGFSIHRGTFPSTVPDPAPSKHSLLLDTSFSNMKLYAGTAPGMRGTPPGLFAQQTRNLLMDLGEQTHRVKFMISDAARTSLPRSMRSWPTPGSTIVLCNVRTPRMNAIVERWIGGCRRELLDRTLVWNQAHLRRILREYEIHHNQHRPHRSLDTAAPLNPYPNRSISPSVLHRRGSGSLICHAGDAWVFALSLRVDQPSNFAYSVSDLRRTTPLGPLARLRTAGGECGWRGHCGQFVGRPMLQSSSTAHSWT